MVKLTPSKQIEANRNSSKGNQLKWTDKDTWYKADYLGYEALSEYVISHLLDKTSVSEHTLYDILPLEFLSKKYIGCKCSSFLKEDQEIITLQKLFRQYKDSDLTKTLAPMNLETRIRYVAQQTSKLTGLKDFPAYLTMLLEMDAFFLNEDRHLNNIAVLRNPDLSYSYCPVFDNGAALFSDVTISYGLELSVDDCYKNIEAKPFSRSFDEQIDIAEELYGIHFSYWFTEKDIMVLLQKASFAYSPQITERVLDVLRQQMRKYRYFRKK